MKTSSKTLLLALATVATLGMLPQVAGSATTTSMRGTDVNTADAVAEPKPSTGKRPGTQPMVERTFSAQPPVIPHAVENFDEITLEENQCLSCHGESVYKKKNAPMVGKSHFLDRDGKKLKTVSASRYGCVSCHVGQVDAPVLVENEFKGDIASPKKKK